MFSIGVMTLVEIWVCISLMLHVRIRSSCHLRIVFDQHDVVHYRLVCFLFSIFLSYIAKGLAICRLGGVITTQKVLFDSL